MLIAGLIAGVIIGVIAAAGFFLWWLDATLTW
jgi:hypothetical protein